jgi:hypothetical protein
MCDQNLGSANTGCNVPDRIIIHSFGYSFAMLLFE